LNGDNRFLRGNSTSGSTSGSATHSHNSLPDVQTVIGSGTGFAYSGEEPSTSSSSSLPPSYDVVWIMRVR